MSDPKYNKYEGTVRFDDDNIVDIDLQPDTENISVRLNGNEVTGGGEEIFTVTFTEVQGSSGGEFTADKTAAQAKAAYDAGQKVVGVISGSQDYSAVTLYAYYSSGHDVEPPYIDFKGWGPVYGDGDSLEAFKFYRMRLYDSDGETAVWVTMASVN